MLLFFLSTSDDDSSPPKGSDYYARLISEHLPYIEKQCRHVVLKGLPGSGVEEADFAFSLSREGLPENEIDELVNEVIDRLKADDFKALREFKGRSKLTTYLTTIVANLVIDLVRQKKGRSRAKERARERGELGERLYDLVFVKRYSLPEAQAHLEVTYGISEPLDSLQQMVEWMQGRARPHLTVCADGEAAWLVPGKRTLVDDVAEVVVVDPRKNAEAALLGSEKETRARRVVDELKGGLSGEERFMLALRFPDDEDGKSRSPREIGELLDLPEKTVDMRIRRILLRFKEILIGRGCSLDDFVVS